MSELVAEKKGILKDTLVYSASAWIVQSIALFLAIFIRRELGPEAMGVWALLQVFLNYVGYGNLGMANTVTREIPLLRGQGGQEGRMEAIRNIGFTYIALVNFLTSGGLFLFAFLWRGRLSEALFYGLLFLAVVNLLQRANNYLVQLLQAEKAFGLVSRFKIYSAVVNAVLVAALTAWFGLYGLYAATFLSFLYNVVYLEAKSTFRLAYCWKGSELRRLLGFGVPLFTLGVVTTVFNSADRLFIGKVLGLRELGLYSIATMVGGYIFMLPNVFQTVLYPRTLEKFGDAGGESGRAYYSIMPGRLMAAYFSLGIAVCWIAAPAFCQAVLPKYVDGVPALQALLFGYAFLALGQQMGHILLGYAKHLLMLPVNLALLILMFVLDGWAVSRGGGITAVAWITALFYLLSYLVAACEALKPLFCLREAAGQVGVTLLPLGFCLAALLVLDVLWPGLSWSAAFLKLGLYGVLWGVFFWIKRKREGPDRAYGSGSTVLSESPR